MTNLQSAALLTEVRALLQSARAVAARQVNALQVLTNFEPSAKTLLTALSPRRSAPLRAAWLAPGAPPSPRAHPLGAAPRPA